MWAFQGTLLANLLLGRLLLGRIYSWRKIFAVIFVTVGVVLFTMASSQEASIRNNEANRPQWASRLPIPPFAIGSFVWWFMVYSLLPLLVIIAVLFCSWALACWSHSRAQKYWRSPHVKTTSWTKKCGGVSRTQLPFINFGFLSSLT